MTLSVNVQWLSCCWITCTSHIGERCCRVRTWQSQSVVRSEFHKVRVSGRGSPYSTESSSQWKSDYDASFMFMPLSHNSVGQQNWNFSDTSWDFSLIFQQVLQQFEWIWTHSVKILISQTMDWTMGSVSVISLNFGPNSAFSSGQFRFESWFRTELWHH